MGKPIYSQLPYKDIEAHDTIKRVLFCDPSIFYARQNIIPNKRFNHVSIYNIFPKEQGVCNCGCGKKLEGRRTRWATNDCMSYAQWVFFILRGDPEPIKTLLKKYHGYNCVSCGKEGFMEGLDLEHTIPVHKGGGGSWLNNYTLMCRECHKKKTKLDLAKPLKNKPQLTLF